MDFSFLDNLDEISGLAERQNPQVVAAHYEHKAAEHNTSATFRELLPQVSAFASHNHQYDPQPGVVGETETQTIGVRVSLALYEGGGTRSRIREARRASQRRQYQIEETKRRIIREAVSNW